MGGRYGSSVIYVVDKLTRGELRQMGMHRLKSRTVPPGTDRHNPTIGVDCNMVINVVGRFKKNPVASLASFLEEWADHGFVLIPVVDGATPNSKQATMERIAKGKTVGCSFIFTPGGGTIRAVDRQLIWSYTCGYCNCI